MDRELGKTRRGNRNPLIVVLARISVSYDELVLANVRQFNLYTL